MKNLSITIICLAATAIISSCNKSIYSPAIYQNDMLLMQKPHSQDEKKSAVYASGQYIVQSSTIYNGSMIEGGVLNVYRSHTFSNFNLSYGLVGFAGSERDSTSTGGIHHHSFTGLGVNTSVSYYKNFDAVDWRIFGIDMIYTKEFGNYLAYRKTIAPNEDTYVAKQAGLYTLTAFTEVIGKPSDKVRVGGRVFLSQTLGPIIRDLHFNNKFDLFAGATAYVGYNRLTGSLTFASPRFFQSASLQFGLGYRF